MSIIKITGSGAYEQTQEKNHALEYLRRCLTAHKEKSPLDHPDGSVSEEKLSPELRERLKNNTESISNAENKLTDLEADSHTHTNKDILDSITETPYSKENIDSKISSLSSRSITNMRNINSLRIDNADQQTLIDNLSSRTSAAQSDIQNLKADTVTKTELNTRLLDKADKTEIPTKVSELENDTNYVTNTDYATALETKADKTDIDWKLIGEVTTDKEAESVVLDLREPITKWYSETMIRVEIPKCKDLGSNASISSGKLRVMFGNTPEQAVGGSGFLPISNSQTNNNLVTPSKDKEQGYVITSVWKDKENIDYSYIGFRSEGASNGYVNTPYFTYVKDVKNTTRSIINRQYLGLHCFYSTYVDGVEVKTFCTLPKGTKMALYGRI